MIIYKYTNLTGNATTQLECEGIIDSINLANVHATDSVNIDLSIISIIPDVNNNFLPIDNDWTPLEAGSANTYYFLKNVTIPFGVTLVLDDLHFDYSKYYLNIKLSAADSAVDIGIKENTEIPRNY
jgi:hypothetical protein